MSLRQQIFKIYLPNLFFIRKNQCYVASCKPQHLICFRNWNCDMVLSVIGSAINLKTNIPDTRGMRLDTLKDSKIMIIQEVNEPILNAAVSKAVTLLGAHDVNIIDEMVWTQDYNGRLFSSMVDAIFVCTRTHMCVKRFSDTSTVPVMCMKSRTHASIQALAIVMTIIELFGTMKSVNISYLGSPHQILNSLLLLCPMLGANIKFKCFGETCPVSPLLFKVSEEMCGKTKTTMKVCSCKMELLKTASVVISGPTPPKKDVEHFKITLKDIQDPIAPQKIFFHTLPKGEEVPDDLFYSALSKTFVAIENMQYISAALMCYCMRNYQF